MNTTSHEKFYGFQNRSSHGTSITLWLTTPGPVLFCRFVHANKSDPLVDQVELKEVNPNYAHVQHMDGRE